MRILLTLGLIAGIGFPALAADENPEVQKQIKLLKSFEQTPRTNAIKQITAMGTEAKEATKPILEILINPKMKFHHIAAMEALEKINPSVYKPAKTLILDNGWFERADALKEVNNLKEDDRLAIFPVVVSAYNFERIQSKGNGFVLKDFFDTLATSYPKEKETQAIFLQAITFVSPQAPASGSRKHALSHITEVPLDKKALSKALMSALNDPDAGTRVKVIEAFGELGAEGKSALPLLKKLKLDRSQDVRDAADNAVGKIERSK